MKTHLDIEKLVESGSITNELDHERALIADRSLRLLAKENAHFKTLRSKLRNLIAAYEKAEWSDIDQVDKHKIRESEKAAYIAESERLFFQNRKQAIKKRLKEFDLTQENLASILGHKSKTHMSELINGIKPFTHKDLIIIQRLLKIDIAILLPTFLSNEDQLKVIEAVQKLGKSKLKLSAGDLVVH